MSDNISFLPYLLLPLEVDFICAWPLLIKWISHTEMSSSVNGLTLTFIRTKIQYAFLPFSRVKTLRFLPFLSFLRHKILVLFRWERTEKGETWYTVHITAWKVSVFGVILVRIFPHFDWIRRDTEYLSVFSSNAGKCKLE